MASASSMSATSSPALPYGCEASNVPSGRTTADVVGAPSKAQFTVAKKQLFSAALYSLGHGTNDAQKTMGIIYILLISSGHLTLDSSVPMWVVLSCHAAMGLGTAAGGWRIVKTMGQKVAKLKPVHGFCAETAGAAMLKWLAM